ncbi:hypothetical protein MG293_001839 [Ovis ammon polii]|uniref:Uncharacterized protein n=1 Tax=Ovis ammon polii TaxID=230172 RepID=A0AAD4UQP5_OVIAM|nr:hypothetical protein MG293_001839 [Ovis ammon polii]
MFKWRVEQSSKKSKSLPKGLARPDFETPTGEFQAKKFSSVLMIMYGLDSKASVYNAGDLVRSLGREDPLEKEMAIHSCPIAWKIPCTEEPGTGKFTGEVELEAAVCKCCSGNKKRRGECVTRQQVERSSFFLMGSALSSTMLLWPDPLLERPTRVQVSPGDFGCLAPVTSPSRCVPPSLRYLGVTS